MSLLFLQKKSSILKGTTFPFDPSFLFFIFLKKRDQNGVSSKQSGAELYSLYI
jgi:hypothetical protein